jgi:polyphenol oxidase
MRARSSGPTRVPEPPGPTPAWLTPDWPAPANVRAASTLRAPGVSLPPFDGFNLALHVGDAPQAVLRNRRHLRTALALPAEPFWLEQVHGTNVATHGEGGVPRADASVAFAPGQVCAVLTADCLPVLFADRAGTCAGAVHAGWRGLADGVIEATVAALGRPPADLLAWLGPAIGQPAFEVGPEVRERFVRQRPEAAAAFVAGRGDRWLADLHALARQRLMNLGIGWVGGGGECTCTDVARFFSFRREPRCGRQATLIWLEPPAG